MFDFKFCPKALFQKWVKWCKDDMKLTNDSNLKVMYVVCASSVIQKNSLRIYRISRIALYVVG